MLWSWVILVSSTALFFYFVTETLRFLAFAGTEPPNSDW